MAAPRRTLGDIGGLLVVLVVALGLAAGSIVINTPATDATRPSRPLAMRSDVTLLAMAWSSGGGAGKGLGNPTYSFRGSEVLVGIDRERSAPVGTLTVAGVAARAAALADIEVGDTAARGCAPTQQLIVREVDVGDTTIFSPTCLRIDLAVDGFPAFIEYRVPVTDGRFARLTPFLDAVRAAVVTCISTDLLTVTRTCRA